MVCNLTFFRVTRVLLSLVSMMVLTGINGVYAQQPVLNTLLLTPEQREEIDRQRLAYLKSLQVGKVEQEKQQLDRKPVVKAGSYKPRNPISGKISVSAIIENPNGERTVRANNQFQTQSTPKIPLDLNQTTSKGAMLKDRGKTVVVPVGSTYFSRKKTVVENYKVQQQRKKISAQPKKAILDADNRGIKQTLKDVKTVNTPQK